METTAKLSFSQTCPVPTEDHHVVLLSHGAGGRMSHELVQRLFLPAFSNDFLKPLHDGAILNVNGGRIAFTTDSYVVHPIFFPGGDIGDLAVNGTVNDLAMCGATAKFLSSGMVIEEGFPMESLTRVVQSMRRAASNAGVLLVTGDTKVVDRGKGDGIYINTSGIGLIDDDVRISPDSARVGDKVLLSGTIADHGIAVMLARDGFGFDSEIRSDTAPLGGLVEAMLKTSSRIHVMRDPTRGGVATALTEIARSSNSGIVIHEKAIPVNEQVSNACEILGFDPLYVANEGKLLAIVESADADKVLKVMQSHPLGGNAAIIGEVVEHHRGMVVMVTTIGSSRVVDMISGDQLPRIC